MVKQCYVAGPRFPQPDDTKKRVFGGSVVAVVPFASAAGRQPIAFFAADLYNQQRAARVPPKRSCSRPDDTWKEWTTQSFKL